MKYPDFDEYIKHGEPDRKEKGYAWQTAIGLQAVDGLTTSDYLIDTARRHIEGDISIDEVRKLIDSYYECKTLHDGNLDDNTEEADKVSANIAGLLGEPSFAFTFAGLTAIHRRIFEGVFKFAGKIRDYNITKNEWVLKGDTVLYVSAQDIKQAIEYDLEQEKNFNYRQLCDSKDIVNHIAGFVAGLWQIHPFGEGNTRTTAVFTIKYLRSMGFDVNNDLFAKNSWYFRNALVRANYQNIKKGVMYDFSFLQKFFYNLILGENNELRNRSMLIDNNTDSDNENNNRTTTVQATEQLTEQVKRLISSIGKEQYTVKQLMEKVGLKHRPTFLENYLTPAMSNGLVISLYPEKPNHPRQKYLLSVKGLMALKQISDSL